MSARSVAEQANECDDPNMNDLYTQPLLPSPLRIPLGDTRGSGSGEGCGEGNMPRVLKSDVRAVSCSECGSRRGEPCRGRPGRSDGAIKYRSAHHLARVRKAEKEARKK